MSNNEVQPDPVANDRPAIWPIVIENVAATFACNDSVAALLVADMSERHRVGCERYGMPLQAGNGRDALVDAYQEALDLCAYMRQAHEEGAGGVYAIYLQALRTAFDIRRVIATRDRDNAGSPFSSPSVHQEIAAEMIRKVRP